jgi:hypothetical protein
VLHLDAARSIHRRTVAFRHTQAMIDVVAVRSNLDVKDVHPERG